MTTMEPEDTGTDYGMLMPWMPDELIVLYTEAFVEYGNAEMAWAAVRQAPAYDTYFAGNRREDGTLRMTEQEYMSTLDAYDDVFQSVGLNPDLWKSRYVDLIEGDVSADELMAERVMPIYERIIEGGEFIRQQYADDWGLDLTFEAILAAALDPDDIGSKILLKQIARSEIGGEAASSGYNLDPELVERLFSEKNLTRAQADQLFQQAESIVPAMSVLSQRHADPDDPFDINTFLKGEMFGNPQERRRMRRLMAQESSTFTGGAAIAYKRSRTGGVSGLADL